jgi:D-psicose/D-tagatose/L-ribulose 3-epimerase
MNKIGVHALTFIGDIKNQSIEKCLSKVATIGYDVMELPLLNPDLLDTGFVSKAYEKFKIEPTVSLGLSYNTDISSEDEDRVNEGRELLFKALQKTIDIGSNNLCGVIHSALQKNNHPKTKRGYENSLSVIRDLAEKAKQNNIILSLEVVNRYETNIMNTAKDALNYLSDLNMANVKIHMDTYHMNIEEDNFIDPIKQIGKDKLGMYHIGENHRGYLGSGHINFIEAFRALKEINYEGIITFESFSSEVVDPVLSNTLAVWRNLWSNSEDLASKSLDFIKSNL